MTPSRYLWLSSGLLTCLLVFGAGSWILDSRGGGSGSVASGVSPYPELTGFCLRRYGRDGLVTRVEADRLAIAPRRFAFFHLHSVNEALLRNARIETHLFRDGKDEDALIPSASGILGAGEFSGGRGHRRRPSREFGVVTRMLVHGVVLEVYQGDTLALTLRARHAQVGGRRRGPRFTETVLESPGGSKRIWASTVVWDARRRELVIPGRYTAQTAKGPATGRGIRVDLDFRVTALR